MTTYVAGNSKCSTQGACFCIRPSHIFSFYLIHWPGYHMCWVFNHWQSLGFDGSNLVHCSFNWFRTCLTLCSYLFVSIFQHKCVYMHTRKYSLERPFANLCTPIKEMSDLDVHVNMIQWQTQSWHIVWCHLCWMLGFFYAEGKKTKFDLAHQSSTQISSKHQ